MGVQLSVCLLVCPSVCLATFHVVSSIKVCFSVPVIAASVKPCIVIISLYILFKHVP